MVLVACLTAVACLPARYIIWLVPDSLPVRIVGASGTLWHGQVMLALGQPGYMRTLPQPVRWQASLEHGPRIVIDSALLTDSVVLRLDWSGVTLSGQQARIPAALLSAFHAGLATLGPGGALLVRWPATLLLPYRPAPGTPQVTLSWQDAWLVASAVKPLGDFQVTVLPTARTSMQIKLTSQKGPLHARGDGTFDLNSGYLRFNGSIAIDPDTDPTTASALTDLLASMGPLNNGKLALSHY
jgi:general secretion pathway protein N